MRVLLTGGAGFLGSHLAERLVASADTVVVLDDLSAGSLENLPAEVDARVGCVTQAAAVRNAANGCDAIVHLASPVGVDRVASDPTWTSTVIEDGTRNALDAAARHGIPLITISSSEVYGFQPPTPVREEFLPNSIDGDAPRLSYAKAKLAADRMALEAHRRGQSVLVVRPFNLVGARQSRYGGAVLPRFVERALEGSPLEIHGDGTQRRSFLDVRDAARCLEALLAALPLRFGAINLGGSFECSVADLAKRVVARLGSSSTLRFVAPPQSRGGVEIARRVPDLTRLESIVGTLSPLPIESSIDALAAERAPLPPHEVAASA